MTNNAALVFYRSDTISDANAITTIGTIGFGGGTGQFSAANTTDYSSRFRNAAGQQYRVDTNGLGVPMAVGLMGIGAGWVRVAQLSRAALGGAQVCNLCGLRNSDSAGPAAVGGTCRAFRWGGEAAPRR